MRAKTLRLSSKPTEGERKRYSVRSKKNELNKDSNAKKQGPFEDE